MADAWLYYPHSYYYWMEKKEGRKQTDKKTLKNKNPLS